MAAADDEPTKPTPPADTPPKTQNLQPGIVRDPDILVQTKKDANEKKHLAAQLPNAAVKAATAKIKLARPRPYHRDIRGIRRILSRQF